MVFECECGEQYTAPDDIAPESFRCHRCGRTLVRRPRNRPPRQAPQRFPGHAGTLAYAGLAALTMAVLAGLVNMAVAETGGSRDRPGVAMRVETAPDQDGAGTQGRGLLKVMNESGRALALRLIGPEYSDSRTVFVPAWDDGHVFGLTPGKWVVKYCTGSGWRPDERRFVITTACAELDWTIQYAEIMGDETLKYDAAIVRFGPSPRESPPAHPITAEDFAAD